MPPGLRRTGDRLARRLAEESAQGRMALWTPILFGAGVFVYFALPREPQLWALVAATAAAGAAAFARRRRGAAFLLCIGIVLLLAGATDAKFQAWRMAAPVLGERLRTTVVVGRVVRGERTAKGIRLVLKLEAVRGLAPDKMPRAAQLTWPKGDRVPDLGTLMRARATLGPAPGPVAPGGYDPARELYFAGIGAVGIIIGRVEFPPSADELSWSMRAARALFALRQSVMARIRSVVPGEEGAVISALLAGDSAALSADTNNDLRASGLAHIISISGLHMALCAGSVFAFLWSALALVPGLALRRPIRKWAAAAALAATTFYLALSGAEYAAQRSYVMVAIMFLAILCDRKALAMRNVALAALIVILIAPESVLSASFQMSFAAAAVLVAGYEAGAARLHPHVKTRSLVLRLPLLVIGVLAGVAVTSLIAGLAVDPFAVLHFHRMAVYGIAANMAAGPVVDLLVMPLGFASLAVMPFGLDPPLLEAMRWGVAWMLWVGREVAAWPGAVVPVAAMPTAALWLFVAGALWFCVWRGSWRFWGVGLAAAAWLLTILAPERFDVLIDANGRTAAARQNDGRLVIIGRSRFAAERWLEADADSRGRRDPSLKAGTGCDALGCVGGLSGGRILAVTLQPRGFVDDCRRATILVTPLRAPAGCDGPKLVVDRARLVRYGAHAVDWPVGAAEPRITTARPGLRPWVPVPAEPQ